MNFDAETPTEIITPYKVVLAVVISNYCNIVDGRHDWVYDIRDLGDADREKKRKFYMSLLTWTYLPEGCLKSILRGVAAFSEVLHDSVVRTLRELCYSPSSDDIDMFLANFAYLFGEPCIANLMQLEGALALFGRRLSLEYEKMDYSQFRCIQKELTKYCGVLLESKKDVWSSLQICGDFTNRVHSLRLMMNVVDAAFADPEENNSDSIDDMELESQSEMDSKSSDGSTHLGDLKPSDLKTEVKFGGTDAYDIYTSRQAEFFCSKQVALIIDKETQALPPDKIQSKISQMLKNNPKLTEVHYLGYLNCLRINEFCGAVDHLLTFFNKRAKTGSSTSEEAGKVSRFAALHLAQLHLKFGHKNAALAAAQEAVDLSQLAGDTRSLQHAMCLMAEIDPQNVQLSLIEHQVKPAIRMGLIPLASQALFRDATKQAMSGKRPSSIFVKLASNEALAHSDADQSLNLTGYTFKGALWKLYGKTQMASLFCQLALSNHCTGYQEYHPYLWQPNTPDVALSLCHLSEILHESGEIIGSQEIIQHVKQRFPKNSEHSKLWQVTELRLRHLAALRNFKFSEAAQAEQELITFDKQQAELRKAERLYYSGDRLKAHKVLLDLLDANEKEHDSGVEFQKCGAEIKCQIYIYLGCLLFNEASDNAAATLYLLKAISTSAKYYLHKYLVRSKLLLAQLQMYSSCFKNARRTLQSCFYECHTHGTMTDKSSMKIIQAKCNLFSRTSPSVSDVNDAILAIEEANQGFEKLQDLHRRRDSLYYLARLHHQKAQLLERNCFPDENSLQDTISKRNKYASQFKQIDSMSFSSSILLI